ncbi:MAG: 3-ketoacyl-ACP reductase [Clostridia bacterium]|nr:3-ketoacyl-ACP reductase [Clostridia bacterium]
MKTAIITGASRGIGLGIAKQLYNDGCNIAILDLADPADVAKTLAENGFSEDRTLYVKGDLTKVESRDELIAKTKEKFGAIDILVNNAGVAPRVRADLLDMSEESFDFVMSVNVKGNLLLTQAVAKQMIAQPFNGKRKGVIVNISSCSAYTSSVNRGEYCVSKAGVAMLTKLFADRLASEGINVFEVRPGIIATDMTSKVTEKYDRLICEQGILPIARWGTPEDVAGAVSVLCDDRLSYCTGDIINADGGFHIQRL